MEIDAVSEMLCFLVFRILDDEQNAIISCIGL
jgi:hypothetical protein